MKTWLIVRNEDLEVLGYYQAEEKDESSNNRSHLWSRPLAMHVECPEDVDPSVAKCEIEEDEVVVSEDSAKVAAKQEIAWANLRAERDSRLQATDKYMLSDYPISPSDKLLVEEYRSALRDLPEETEDPSEPTWPVLEL